jgi:hypothetical protein
MVSLHRLYMDDIYYTQLDIIGYNIYTIYVCVSEKKIKQFKMARGFSIVR